MKRTFRVFVLLLGLWLLFDLASHLAAEILWFDEVGYLQVFWLRLLTQLGLCAIAFFTSAGFLLFNLAIANREGDRETGGQRDRETRETREKRGQGGNSFPPSPPLPIPPSPHLPPRLSLHFLLPVVLGLSALVGLILIYYCQETLNFWHFLEKSLLSSFYSKLGTQNSALILLLGLTIAILSNYQFCLSAIALLISLLFGFLLSARWDKFLQCLHSTSFQQTEPLFHKDINFYVFSLPIWDLLASWLLGLLLYSTASVALVYLLSGNSLSEGRFKGFSVSQRLHLNALTSLVMLAIAFHYYLQRYHLLYSTDSVNYGASYTAVEIQLPIYTWLSFLAVAIAIYLLLRVIILSKAKKTSLKSVPYPRQLIYALGIYLIIAAISGKILPSAVQRFIVQPNELARERPYIQRTIEHTRQAFNLNKIEAETFDPKGELTAGILQENNQTIRNIRLWDTRPLLQTNRQLQQIRPYYKFPGADIDRYTLKKEGGRGRGGQGGQGGAGKLNAQALTEKQQTIIAARELDYTAVPQQAQTWVNKHLVYTHGYGFTLSPVNTVVSGGLPDYYVKDIGVDRGKGSLQISNEAIRASIPIGEPRIYYGENTNTYVMTGTTNRELDYPSGSENVYNVYDGRGGIAIGARWRRLLFAEYLKDWQMLLARNFHSGTKLLFRRNILERVRAIAPFLRYDSDPYLVAADAGGTNSKSEKTYLYWILDAYTTSDRYPYSDPGKNKFNYIRNSVKVVIDAYNGNVNFYIADPQDPIIKTLAAIFPNLLKPLDVMPDALKSHIRYPVDLFSIQSERLLAYHMIDAQVFYNREDLWQIPTEIYGSEPRPVEPYYLIMKLPTAATEEFILLLPFTPTQRPNLIAWLAARSDQQEYGKLLLYEFPKQQLIYGQEQIEALINQDPVISQQISLWNRAGSRVIQGNLLVIPIEQSLLYVEPLYLEAEQNSLPTLVRVIVVYQNRIVMAETLQKAIDAVFQSKTPNTPAIVRPVE
ncbi:hypothetical protein NIES4075_59440 [Tolypothrix sp. NIES-4075]|uniref:UPF0182 family protein n=1 Tax=Tolypothrix sp. NIES-4075 TaxID=2005459 RepID=UPI000B5CC24B|nr:UPF0182 family protein [Tolypothrix sp. NIES-4075]GAX44925.1 hypothetical protein NIES4075_59440 [Tolypothrix sp. NIES-4075]